MWVWEPQSVGTPVIHSEVRIVDPDDRPLPAGEAGEIVIRGPSVTKGYLANPAAIQQYSGLKYTDDRSDARWLAHRLRFDI